MTTMTTVTAAKTKTAKVKAHPIKPFPHLERYRAFTNEKRRAFYCRAMNNDLAFAWVNREYRRLYRQLKRPKLDQTGERIVADLKANGIALARLEEFFERDFLDAMRADFRAYQADFEASSRRSDRGKAIFLDTVHKAHTFEDDSATSRFLAEPRFAAIAAAYMAMVPRFVGSSFWHTRQAPASERIYSQTWHRDYNDRRLVKIFLYLTDVGPENGYFEYMTDSHGRGRFGRRFDRTGVDGYRAYPEQAPVSRLAEGLPLYETAKLPAEQLTGSAAPWHGRPSVVRCTAPAGTLIFADTFGLHRGGFVEEGHRDMVMSTFSTNFNIHKPHFAVAKAYAKRLSPFMRAVFGLA